MQHYRIHGGTVASDLDLHLPEAEYPGGQPDLTIRRSARPVEREWEPVHGDVLADTRDEGRTGGYVAARTPDGYRLRFLDTCEFDVTSDLGAAAWRVWPGRAALVPVLAAGALMAFRLTIAGNLVLHASAVRVRQRGLAFVGASGMGKSTMAALMCASGATMVTDDVARVIVEENGVRLAHGGRESRLRPAAAGVAELFAHSATRVTGDGRTAVTLPGTCVGSTVLDAVVIPRPTRDHDALGLTPLTPAQALILLGQFPRLPGWVDRQVLDRQFQLLGDVVERVPVYVAMLPWGPPYDPATGPRLLDALGWGARPVTTVSAAPTR